MSNEELLTVAETAKRLGLSVSCLNKWRLTGSGPKFFKIGSRLVKYRWSDVSQWLDNQARASTSDIGKAA